MRTSPTNIGMTLISIQILRRQAVAAAQLGKLAERLQPLAGVRGDRLQARDEQVGVGALGRAPHPPADLVQLREPEVVGPIDDDGVGRRDVQPGLDDRGADEHVDLARDEVGHDGLEPAIPHLAVGDGGPGLRHDLADEALHGRQAFYPIVQEVDLPPA